MSFNEIELVLNLMHIIVPSKGSIDALPFQFRYEQWWVCSQSQELSPSWQGTSLQIQHEQDELYTLQHLLHSQR